MFAPLMQLHTSAAYVKLSGNIHIDNRYMCKVYLSELKYMILWVMLGALLVFIGVDSSV